MACVLYIDAVREFEAALAEIRAYVSFVSSSNRVRPWVGKMVIQDGLDETQRSALQSFVSQKDYSLELGFNGLTVCVVGTFEHFVRRLIRDGVVRINASYTQFEKLQEGLRNHNLKWSGQALITVFDPPSEASYDYEMLCKNLGTCRTKGGELILNADAFSANITNITPTRIDDSLKRIGVQIDWDVFGASTKLKTIFGKTGARDTTNEIKRWLKQFITTRNRIAHSAVGGIQISERELMFSIEVLETFSPILAEAIEGILKQHHK